MDRIRIRQERREDYDEVYQLIQEAFRTAEHADGNEQDLVAALRKGRAFIPELSLVAEVEGQLAGHILFTRAKAGERKVLALHDKRMNEFPNQTLKICPNYISIIFFKCLSGFVPIA